MEKKLLEFKRLLYQQEKSKNTIEKYVRDINHFFSYVKRITGKMPTLRVITKELCIAYKLELQQEYAYASVNSMLTALNQFLIYLNKGECTVKLLKIQKQIFQKEERNLNKKEYKELVKTAYNHGNRRLAMIMETMAATGIRIGELRFFDVKSVKLGRVSVDNKGKMRTVFIPHKLQMKLLSYLKGNQIQQGCVFITSQNNPIDRSNVWKEMKKIAKIANVCLSKVFPHNLRHLFAVTFYHLHKDIVKLADVLGHASINTTRIYTITSGQEHKRKIGQLGLV